MPLKKSATMPLMPATSATWRAGGQVCREDAAQLAGRDRTEPAGSARRQKCKPLPSCSCQPTGCSCSMASRTRHVSVQGRGPGNGRGSEAGCQLPGSSPGRPGRSPSPLRRSRTMQSWECLAQGGRSGVGEWVSVGSQAVGGIKLAAANSSPQALPAQHACSCSRRGASPALPASVPPQAEQLPWPCNPGSCRCPPHRSARALHPLAPVLLGPTTVVRATQQLEHECAGQGHPHADE